MSTETHPAPTAAGLDGSGTRASGPGETSMRISPAGALPGETAGGEHLWQRTVLRVGLIGLLAYTCARHFKEPLKQRHHI